MKALFYESMEGGVVTCRLCPHACRLAEGKTGFCGARENREGLLLAQSYGHITSLALDPIEKKPLYHFHPGSKILSLGGYGCNFRCGFCQNHSISMNMGRNVETKYIFPEETAELAVELVPYGHTTPIKSKKIKRPYEIIRKS